MKKINILTAAVTLWSSATFAQTNVNAVMESSLRILDPVITTTFITRYHGYMIYDTLIAHDSKFQPKPQMADWTLSNDRLTYKFTLRDGLKFHDGAAVTSGDVVASIKRWAQRDTGGQIIMSMTETLEAPDDKTIAWKLTKPFNPFLDILAKQSSLPLFIMPARVAKTPANESITDYIGSGPFMFVQKEFQPGVNVTYKKFDGYVPRKEPADGMAGGKVVHVDNVKWISMPDMQTAVGAITSGEIDYIERIPVDMLPLVQGDKSLKIETRGMTEMQSMARMNFLHPPFNNPKIRQAALKAISQKPVLAAVVGSPDYYKVCGAVLGCGTTYGNETGASSLTTGNGLNQAKQLLSEAGYDGSPVILLAPTDNASLATQPVTISQMLRTAGFTVQLQQMDWQTLTTRRASQAAPDKGGWGMFVTNWMVIDVSNPITNAMLNGKGNDAWFGWPNDKAIEGLKADFISAGSTDSESKVAEKIQAHAIDQVLEVPLGQFTVPQVRRTSITDMLDAPTPVFWQLRKKAN